MKLEEIQALIKFVAKSGVSEVDLEMGDVKLNIKVPGAYKKEEIQVAPVTMMAPPAQQVVSPASSNAPAPAAQAVSAATAPPAEETISESNLVEIKSPMIGTFYRRASPDKPNFVAVGDQINPGDIICIIEAMKLFNEIESEISGKIVKVLVDDASPVEYDQVLFLVEP
ncbi:MAG: acetyl-CoA carboxylase biotin carboxyl carrier protein [Flavobacteriales bacterium]|nr:acetyl-CoA carboxylase biotin carboxyl carrier protein [Flavobacteriales bacterium]